MPNISRPGFTVRWLAIACFISLSGGCSDKFQRAAQHATQSEAQFASGNLDDARINIQKAISERDDVAAYYILLGRIEVRAQRPINAFKAYSTALDLEADNLEVLQNIADIGLQTGRVQEAQEAANRMLLLAPASTGAILINGLIAIDEGQFGEAEKAVSDIMEIDPEDEGGVVLAARIDALEGRPDAALAKIDKSISTIGATNALNITRLEIFRLLGNAKGMAEVFPQILKNVDDNSQFRLDYINLFYKTENKAAARKESLALLLDQPNDRILLNKLYSIWMEYDSRPLSEANLESIAASGTHVTKITLARHYFMAGSATIASRLLSELVKARVAEAVALNARILLEQGQKQAAYDGATRVLISDARNDDALLVRSAQNMDRKNYDQAIRDANVVMSDAPLNPMGYVALAQAHFAKGATVRARQIFEKGMDAMPQSLLLAAYYNKLLSQIGDSARIVSLSREVAIASPSSIKASNNYLMLCRRYGDGSCADSAAAGLARANRSYVIDEPPGTPLRRGLFARITPEKICSTTGGICTGT